MVTKEWLKGAREIDKEINQLLIAKQEACEKALGGAVDISKEKVQSSNGNSVEYKFVNLADYEYLIDKKIDELFACKMEILKVINKVKNNQYRTLLVAYYINCKSFEKIAEEMDYSTRWIHTLHKRALEKIGEV